MAEITKNDRFYESILADFCGNRKNLDKPLCDGKYTYVSDGKVIVRLPVIMEVGKTIDIFPATFPDVAKLQFKQKGKFVSLPELPEEANGICDSCKGRGERTTCPECDGNGRIYHDTAKHEYEWECEECDSTGYIPGEELACTECNGTGATIANFQENISIKGCKFQLGYLRKLSKLPGVLISVFPASYQLYFKFDGGDGILMGVK